MHKKYTVTIVFPDMRSYTKSFYSIYMAEEYVEAVKNNPQIVRVVVFEFSCHYEPPLKEVWDKRTTLSAWQREGEKWICMFH